MKKTRVFSIAFVILAIVLSSFTFSSLAYNIYGREVLEGGCEEYSRVDPYDFTDTYQVSYDGLVSTYYSRPSGSNATVRTVLRGQTKPSGISADDFFQHAYASLVSTDGEYEMLDSVTLTSSGVIDSGTLVCSTSIPMRTDHFAEVWDVENNELHDIWDIVRYAEDYYGIYSIDETKVMSQYTIK